jgi:hypothetical protein
LYLTLMAFVAAVVRTTTFPVNVMVSNWNYHALFPPKLSAIYNHLTELGGERAALALGRTKDKRASVPPNFAFSTKTDAGARAMSICGVGLPYDSLRVGASPIVFTLAFTLADWAAVGAPSRLLGVLGVAVARTRHGAESIARVTSREGSRGADVLFRRPRRARKVEPDSIERDELVCSRAEHLLAIPAGFGMAANLGPASMAVRLDTDPASLMLANFIRLTDRGYHEDSGRFRFVPDLRRADRRAARLRPTTAMRYPVFHCGRKEDGLRRSRKRLRFLGPLAQSDRMAVEQLSSAASGRRARRELFLEQRAQDEERVFPALHHPAVEIACPVGSVRYVDADAVTVARQAAL